MKTRSASNINHESPRLMKVLGLCLLSLLLSLPALAESLDSAEEAFQDFERWTGRNATQSHRFSVKAGRIFHWSESDPTLQFDHISEVASGLQAWWSISSPTLPSAFFYGVNFPDTEVALAPQIQHISEVTDASSFSYNSEDWSSGTTVRSGDFVFFRHTKTGYYAAIRVDDINASNQESPQIDVTWYLQENNSSDFSDFLFFDDLESGGVEFWSEVVP